MSTVKLMLRDDRTRFRPGEQIEGGVAWQLDRRAKSIEVRLFYYTKGKGTTDLVVVDHAKFEDPPPERAEKFEFCLPAAPYSFSGKLISFVWAVEAVVLPGKQSARLEFVVSPSGREIDLDQTQLHGDRAASDARAG